MLHLFAYFPFLLNVKFKFVKVHSLYHAPDQAEVIAAELMVKMKKEIQKDPTAPVGLY